MLCAMERISKILGENDPSLFQPQCYEAPSTGHPHLKPCLGEGHQVHASPFMFWLHWPPQHLCTLLLSLTRVSQCGEWDKENIQSHSNLCLPSCREGTADGWAHGRMFGLQGDQHLPPHRAYRPLLAVRVCRNFVMTSRGGTKVRAWAMQWELM